MPTRKSPRKGSLQFWPRKRANKFLPSVNWDAIDSAPVKNLKGFIAYKAGMMSAIVKDSTEHSMTKGKKIAMPATILECPPMKIFSVRFYKHGKVAEEVLAGNPDKELKRKVKLPKAVIKKIESVKPENYDDIRVIAYSIVNKTNLKKTPDISEIGLKGTVEEKLAFVNAHLGKEISVADVFEKGQLVDARGLSRGRGFQGPVKRFGITLRFHKTEKGQRKVGSIAPWNPSRVTFRTPMAGQLGMFTRAVYNNKILEIAKAENKKLEGIKNYGEIKTDYLIVRGSIQGPSKRQLLLTAPLRKTKKQTKKNLEFTELR